VAEPLETLRDIFGRVANGAKKVYHALTLDGANTGWDHKSKPPVLSPKRKKELLTATSLDTPHSTMQAIRGILTPYWKNAGWQENTVAASLLVTSLAMTWVAVDITVDFTQWQGDLMNNVQQIYQAATTSRAGIIDGIIDKYPDLNALLQQDPLLKDIFYGFPDLRTMSYNHEGLNQMLKENPDVAKLYREFPTLKDVFLSYPGLQEKLAANPDWSEMMTGQLKSFSLDLGKNMFDTPKMNALFDRFGGICGSHFIENWKNAVGSSIDVLKNGTLESAKAAKDAFSKAWDFADLPTIALKFTGMAMIAFTSAQYLALRWRSWTTGYYTGRWADSNAYYRIKNYFHNIDNPDQRIEQDPDKFTQGAVSLMTGVLSAGMTLVAYADMLGHMSGDFNLASVKGPELEVPGVMLWVAGMFAAGLTWTTYKVGYKLPQINRDQQKFAGYFRSALKKVADNTDQIALNKGEKIEVDLVKKSFNPVIKNSAKAITKQKQLILVDSTASNLSIPIPWVAGSVFIATGIASMGSVQVLASAFNRVTNSLSFIVNRFSQLSEMKATADRIYMFDQAIELAHYMEEEKKQATTNPPPPSGPAPQPQLG